MKKLLLASVSSFALASMAYGADMTMPLLKAPPPPPASWAGLYIGIDGGVARHDAYFNNLDGAFDPPSEATLSTTATGGFGGGFIGYNFQDRSFVYGLEADINGFAVKAQEDWNAANVLNDEFHSLQSQEVPWVATFRGRLGLDVESTLFYFTGGLAVGQVKNSLTDVCAEPLGSCLGLTFPTGTTVASFSENTTRLGFAVGAGFEHLFGSHFLLRGEMRYVDLGKSQVTCANSGATIAAGDNFCSNNTASPNYRGEFSNSLMTGSLGLGYKF